ncbi:hypothetical protein SDC9_42574 [bioreactor metagenome]|uniref:Uncharacterized protein n=1 Tax=bioreactor metagenome TaxID=1076179 RepID=A0A644VYK2_9ZZZZ
MPQRRGPGSDLIIVAIPVDEGLHPLGHPGLRMIAGQRLQKRGVGPGRGHVPRLHRHQVALGHPARRRLDRGDVIGQLHRLGIADVDDAPRRHRREAVALGHDAIRGPHRHRVDQQADRLDQIGDIGEVALHVAVIVDIDRPAFEDRLGELEQRHVRPAPGTVDGEEAEHGDRQAEEMGIGMRHRLGRLLRRGIEGHLVIGLHHLAIGHLGVRAIGRGGGSEQHMRRREGPRRLEDLEGADDVALEIGARVLDRVAHARLRGQMHHHVGAVLVEEAQHQAGGLDAVIDHREARVLAQHRLPAFLQRDVVIIRQVVEPDHPPALVEQTPAQVETDEAGRAGDERGAGGKGSGHETSGQIPPFSSACARRRPAFAAREGGSADAGGVHHPGKALDARVDHRLVRHREVQPQRIAVRAVGEEGVAGHEGDLLGGQRAFQQLGPVIPLGQVHPDEHAALGAGPAHAFRHVPLERGEHRLKPRAIDLAQHRDVLVEELLGDLGGDHLVQRRGLQVGSLLHQHHLADDRLCRHHPAHAQTGRQRLREGAAIDRPAGLEIALAAHLDRQQRRIGRTRVAQRLIGCVLDHRDVERFRHVEHRLALGQIQRDAGRVGEIGREIGEFHPPARGFGIGRDLGRATVRRRVEPVIARLIGVEGAKRAQIGRPADKCGVVRVDEQLAEVIERLLRARGDQHVLGRAGDAQRRHVADDPAAQRQIALGLRILQRGARRLGRDGAGHGARKGLAREQRRVGDAAGKGNDLGLVQKLEQLADLRGLHSFGPRGKKIRQGHAFPQIIKWALVHPAAEQVNMADMKCDQSRHANGADFPAAPRVARFPRLPAFSAPRRAAQPPPVLYPVPVRAFLDGRGAQPVYLYANGFETRNPPSQGPRTRPRRAQQGARE